MVIDLEKNELWDKIVKQHEGWLPTQLSGWQIAFEVHKYDGKAYLWWDETDDFKAMYPFFVRTDEVTGDIVAITPYLSTGMMVRSKSEHDVTEEEKKHQMRQLFQSLDDAYRSLGVVREQALLRFDTDPGYDVNDFYTPETDITTHFIHAGSEADILKNMNTNNRRNVKAARSAGVELEECEFTGKCAEELAEIYNDFISRKEGVMKYYLFSKSFFCSLAENMRDYVRFFRAKCGEEICGEILIIYGNGLAHLFILANTPLGYETKSSALCYLELAKYFGALGCDKMVSGGTARNTGLGRFKKGIDCTGETVNRIFIRHIKAE